MAMPSVKVMVQIRAACRPRQIHPSHRLRLAHQRDVAGGGLVPARRHADEGWAICWCEAHGVIVGAVRRALRPHTYMTAWQFRLIELRLVHPSSSRSQEICRGRGKAASKRREITDLSPADLETAGVGACRDAFGLGRGVVVLQSVSRKALEHRRIVVAAGAEAVRPGRADKSSKASPDHAAPAPGETA